MLQDDWDRENEGDFIGAASTATKASVALMLRHTSGVLCAPLTPARASALRLPLMVPDNEDPFRTAFTVTVDYRYGTSTGISAADRACTLRAMASPQLLPDDFSRPGHVFPLLARPGGVLVRGGHTEAGVDLVRLAGLPDVAYLSEVYDHASGDMTRLDALAPLAVSLGLPLISIADLQAYRYRRETLVRAESAAAGSPARAFRSLYDPDAWYAVDEEGREAGGAVEVRVVFADDGAGGGLLSLKAAEEVRRLTITAHGPYRENVRGKASSNLATMPADKGATVEGASSVASAELTHVVIAGAGAVEAPRKPAGDGWPASAYSSVYPPCSGGESAGRVVSDRASAELAQVVTAVLRSAAPQAMFRGATLEGAASVVAAAVADEEDAVLAARQRDSWPAVVLVAGASQPLPRLWEFGVTVIRVE